MQVIVLNNQTLADLAVRYCGTLEALPDIAILNTISMTETLEAGLKINIPTKDYGFSEVVHYFEINKKQPATGLEALEQSQNNSLQGIDYWAIATDFIIQ